MLSKLTAQRTKLWNKIHSQKKRSTCTCRPIKGSVDLFAVCFHSNGIYAKALQTVRNRSGKVSQFPQMLYTVRKNAANFIQYKNGRKMERWFLSHVFDLENQMYNDIWYTWSTLQLESELHYDLRVYRPLHESSQCFISNISLTTKGCYKIWSRYTSH